MCLKNPRDGALFLAEWGTRMFIFVRHRLMMNTEYGYNPSTRSSNNSKAHRQTDRHSKNHSFVFEGGGCKYSEPRYLLAYVTIKLQHIYYAGLHEKIHASNRRPTNVQSLFFNQIFLSTKL